MDTSLIQIRAVLERQQMLNRQQQRRLARKIHDDISQKMTLLSLQLSLASTDERPPKDWAKSCQDWSNLVMELGQSVREIVTDLQPRVTEDQGLASAFRWFSQTVVKTIYCAVEAPKEDIPLEPFVANELFGICREIISDVLVPAKAPRVEIELEQQDGAVRLRLRANHPAHDGDLITDTALDNLAIRERLQCLDGTAELDNLEGEGSVVTLSVPANITVPCAAA